jgi:acetyl esterase/lipase
MSFYSRHTMSTSYDRAKHVVEVDFRVTLRLYQALDQANIPVKLDVYEGMPHIFQLFFYNTTESDLAI